MPTMNMKVELLLVDIEFMANVLRESILRGDHDDRLGETISNLIIVHMQLNEMTGKGVDDLYTANKKSKI